MADNLFISCATDWEEYPQDLCVQVPSGMDGAVLFKPGVARADFTTMDEIDPAKIQTLLNDGSARIINGLRIGIEAPSAVTGDSFVACEGEAPTGYDRTITWKDRKVTKEATIFYNSLNGVTGFRAGGMLIHECAAEQFSYIDRPLTFTGGRVAEEADNTLQRWEFTAAFKGKKDPEIFDWADIMDLVPASPASPASPSSP